MNVKLAAWITGLGSIWVMGLGIGHFPLAHKMAAAPQFSQLPAEATDFVILACQCIGILLIFVGMVSIYFARRWYSGDSAARHFFFAEGVLFLVRTILELMHPVAVPEPDPAVLVNLFLTAMIFFIPAVLLSVTHNLPRKLRP